MTKVIDTSIVGATIAVSVFAGQIVTVARKGFRTVSNYNERDIAEVSAVSEESFRHGGKAVAGAIIGGVLTGGIGFLAGAAFGGRRRKEVMYAIVFNDGNHVVIDTSDKKLIAKLQPIIIRKNLNLSSPQPARSEPKIITNQSSADPTQEALRLLSSGRSPDDAS